MNSNILEVDLSRSENDDKIKIEIGVSESVDVNFPKFFLQSKMIQEKYKYSEAIENLQNEIYDIKNKNKISNENLKAFIDFFFKQISLVFLLISFQTYTNSQNISVFQYLR